MLCMASNTADILCSELVVLVVDEVVEEVVEVEVEVVGLLYLDGGAYG